MIQKQELLDLAADFGLQPNVVEKDYVLGWLLAVPLGWIIGRILVEVVTSVFHFGSVPYSFPASYPPLALLPTLALSWLAILAPLRRASSLRPGDALRYE